MGKSVRSILIYLLRAWSLFLGCVCRCMKWAGNLCGGEKKAFSHIRDKQCPPLEREENLPGKIDNATNDDGAARGKTPCVPPPKKLQNAPTAEKNPRVPIISLPLFSARDCYSNFPSQMTVCFWEREAKFSCSLLSTHSFPPQTNE